MLIEKRKKRQDERIHELFYEIDYLGNTYTKKEWFQCLTRQKLMIFYSHLLNYWTYEHIETAFKLELCYLTNGDPFYNIIINSNSISFDDLKEACLIVMENLTFTGINSETRKMGIIYILLNLAKVCNKFKDSISWLQ